MNPRQQAPCRQSPAAPLRTLLSLLVLSLLGQSAIAGTGDAYPLDAVVVSASRTEQRVMDTAASVSVVNSAQIHDGQAEANLSEPLRRSPGIFALNRQNYAQDLLISSRGFGANSTFGVRGIRLYVDGIPGTMADGQGQISHIDLASASRIEAMRGPFSVLYGNSAGGVISVFTENGRPGAAATPYFSAGSHGRWKYGLKLNGERNGLNYVAHAGVLHTAGYRNHSAAGRRNQNAKLGFSLGEDTAVTLVANSVNLKAQDPLGLTAAQLALDPRAAPNVANFDTRKTVAQIQGGLTIARRMSKSDSVTLTPYIGHRRITQFLPAAANGVIDLSRDFHGMDGKWLHAGAIGHIPALLTAGLESGASNDRRLTYANLSGVKTGNAGQDYTMSARNLDLYAQLELRPADRVVMDAGLRRSKTRLSSISNASSAVSPGANTYQATTGMAAVQYYPQENTNLYLSFGTGFDTPTLNQAYYSPSYVNGLKPDGSSSAVNLGNINLPAARTRQVEIGFKSRLSASAQVIGALFDAKTSNEIVIDSSNFGKTAFGSAPKTGRRGLELSAQAQLPYGVRASMAYTLLNTTVEGYRRSDGTLAANGARIPGVPRRGLFTELLWRQVDNTLELAIEGRAAGSMAANDTNAAFAGGYMVIDIRALARQDIGGWTCAEFVRVDNIFDRAYVGSVIVNQARSQYYESAPGRDWLAGVKATYQF